MIVRQTSATGIGKSPRRLVRNCRAGHWCGDGRGIRLMSTRALLGCVFRVRDDTVITRVPRLESLLRSRWLRVIPSHVLLPFVSVRRRGYVLEL